MLCYISYRRHTYLERKTEKKFIQHNTYVRLQYYDFITKSVGPNSVNTAAKPQRWFSVDRFQNGRLKKLK